MGPSAAVALAGHFTKGNASAKEAIDRISGSGVFARDPDKEKSAVKTYHEHTRKLPILKPRLTQRKTPRRRHPSFQEYCHFKWADGRNCVERLISAAQVCTQLMT